jgi:type IV secretion system protein VirD4
MRKAVEWVIGGLLAGIVIFLVGGMVAIVGMNQFKPDINPMKLPEYFWFYRDNAFVMGWLYKGMGGTVAALALLALVLKLQPPKLHGDARWAREGEIRKAGLRAASGIFLGVKSGKPLNFGGTEHVLMEAPTRSGKGVSVVIPNLLQWTGSAVVLDIKQENWTKTAGFRSRELNQDVYLFNPLDRNGRTARYNPLGHIDAKSPLDVIADLQRISEMLFAVSEGDKNPFFIESARKGFVGIGAYLAAIQSDPEPMFPFTIGEIFRQFNIGNPQTRFRKIIDKRDFEGNPLPGGCVTLLEDFCSNAGDTFASIKSSATAKLGLWADARVDSATSVSDFELSEIRDRHMSIYLGVSPEDLRRAAPLYNLVCQQIIGLNTREEASKGRHNVPVLVILDEFANLGAAPTIAQAFSYIASYGLRLLPVVQSRSQLDKVYSPAGAKEIITNCGVEIVFTPKELEITESLSKRLGYYTYKGRSKTRKVEGWDWGSTSTSDQRRALLLPQELQTFPESEMILLKAGIPAIRGKKKLYYKDKNLLQLSQMEPPKINPRATDEAASTEASSRLVKYDAVITKWKMSDEPVEELNSEIQQEIVEATNAGMSVADAVMARVLQQSAV